MQKAKLGQSFLLFFSYFCTNTRNALWAGNICGYCVKYFSPPLLRQRKSLSCLWPREFLYQCNLNVLSILFRSFRSNLIWFEKYNPHSLFIMKLSSMRASRPQLYARKTIEHIFQSSKEICARHEKYYGVDCCW